MSIIIKEKKKTGKITIFNKDYDIETTFELNLSCKELTSLPESIGELVNLKILSLYNNQLTSLPESIGKLTNLNILYLENNQLTSLPESIGKLINVQYLSLNESSYEINNLDMECEILILRCIKNKITNLPYNLKKIYLKSDIDINMLKIPFGCEIIRIK
jgi:Leucine-rich repeat (LRR) protein